MTTIRVYPESTAGASPGFTRVDVDGQPHLTLTDFPAYAALGRVRRLVDAMDRDLRYEITVDDLRAALEGET